MLQRKFGGQCPCYPTPTLRNFGLSLRAFLLWSVDSVPTLFYHLFPDIWSHACSFKCICFCQLNALLKCFSPSHKKQLWMWKPNALKAILRSSKAVFSKSQHASWVNPAVLDATDKRKSQAVWHKCKIVWNSFSTHAPRCVFFPTITVLKDAVLFYQATSWEF